MRKVVAATVVVCSFLALVCCFVFGRINSNHEDATSIIFRESIGPLFPSDEVIAHTFSIKNQRPYPVRILKEIPSCTCESVSYERDLLGPGDSMSLTIRARAMIGRTRKAYMAKLKTDDPKSPVWQVVLEASFYPFAEADPDRIVLDGFERNDQIQLKVHAYAMPKSSAVTLTSFEMTSELAGTPPPETRILPDGVIRSTFRMCLTPTTTALDQGLHANRVVCSFSNGGRLQIPISWTVRGMVQVTPERLFLGKVDRTPISKNLVLTCEKNFRILDSIANHDGLHVSALAAEGNDFSKNSTLAVELDPQLATQAGFVGELTIRIETEDGDSHRIVVPFSFLKLLSKQQKEKVP